MIQTKVTPKSKTLDVIRTLHIVNIHSIWLLHARPRSSRLYFVNDQAYTSHEIGQSIHFRLSHPLSDNLLCNLSCEVQLQGVVKGVSRDPVGVLWESN